MKRTFSVLVSLAAITLLSCSFLDNSSSSKEEMDYSQVNTLKKVSQIEEQSLFADSIQVLTRATKAAGCYTRAGTGSMSVSGVRYGYGAWSSPVSFNFSAAPSSLARSHEFTGGRPSGNGTFAIDFVRITCGGNNRDLTSFSYSYLSTTAFAGRPANSNCTAAFYGRCIGTSTGGGSCSYSIPGWTGTVCW